MFSQVFLLLQHFSYPPFVAKGEAWRLTRLTYRLMLVTIILLISTLIGGQLWALPNRYGITSGLMLPLVGLSLLLIRLRQERWGAWLYVFSLWLGFSYITFADGTITSTVMFYGVVVVIAALALSWQGNFLFTAASLLLVAFYFIRLISLDPNTNPLAQEDPLITWGTFSFAIIATSLMSVVAVHSLRTIVALATYREVELETTLENLRQTSVAQDYVNSILNSMLDMLFVLKDDLEIETVNAAAQVVLGYQEHELVGMPIQHLLADEERLSVANAILQLIHGDVASINKTTQMRSIDGERITVNLSASRVASMGANKRIVCIAHNITELSQAQEALEQERNLLRTIIDSIPDEIYARDQDGRYILSNLVHLQRRGFGTQENVIGKTATEIFGEDMARLETRDDSLILINGRTLKDIETVGLNPQGTLVHYSSTRVPLYRPNKEIQGLVVIQSDVTERKQRENQLRRSEERLRAVVSHAPVFIFTIDRENNITFFDAPNAPSQNWDEIGILLGRDIFKPNLESGLLRVSDHVARAFQGEVIKTRVTHDETVLDLRYSPLINGEGNIFGVTGVATSITDQVRIENALRMSEARNRALIEAIPDIVLVLDRDHIVTNYTAAVHDDLIVDSGKIVGKHLDDILPSGNKPSLLYTAHQTCLQTGEAQSIEFSAINNVYESRIVRLNMREALHIIRNVTTNHRAAEEIRRREAMYRMLARNLPNTGVILYNTNYAVLIAEGELLERVGFSSRIEGSLLDEATTQPTLVKLFQNIRQSGKTEPSLQELYLEPFLVCVVTVIPLVDARNRPYAGLVMIQDITEERKAEQELRKYTRELAQSNSQLEEFAYVASHDLQEPLRKIQAFGDRLRHNTQGQLDETSLDYLDRMQKASNRMQQLIEDLLAFSRITTKGQPFMMVNLEDILSGVLNDLELRIEQSHATIEHDPLPSLLADGLQMRQLLQNLIGNALKYHRANLPPIITITSEQFNEERKVWLRLRVSDNGIGFEQKYAERIFGVFQRLHNRNSYEGTGMGLAICRKIIERHEGRITAVGYPDEGAVFIVELPFLEINQGEAHEL